MNKIFAVKGRGKSGKTSTLKLVYTMLKEQFPNATVTESKRNTIDIKVILTVNGVKIGIESQGDPNSDLKSSLKHFADNGCSIIVCASRTRGMTVDWINNYKGIYDIEFVKQSYVEKQNWMDNIKNTADGIVSKITALCPA